MRSQVIKVRNLPEWQSQPHTIHLKPVAALAVFALAGLIMLVMNTFAFAGLIFLITSVFALLMMPDRFLIQFTPEYAILYNHRDLTLCTIVYWEDLVNWQYEYHAVSDTLLLTLTDGSVQSIELYAKAPVARYLNQYAPGKEVKTSRRKEAA
ncbi:MAG: hypothetical protein J6S26_05370 [Solobacterium sp.]|nr:hypothetical protein [Solobacterium sp.]